MHLLHLQMQDPLPIHIDEMMTIFRLLSRGGVIFGDFRGDFRYRLMS